MDAKVLDRVRKLLRLAESCNVHEAANAAARAQALMERHRLDTAALDDDDPGPEAITGHPETPLETQRRLPRWKTGLAAAVAELGGCRVYLSDLPDRAEGKAVIVVGRADDAAGVRVMYRHLCREVERLTRRLGRGQGRRWCTAFRLGAVTTIVERLRSARDETRKNARAEAEAKALVGETTALARVDRGLARLQALDEALDAWLRANLRLRRRRPRTVYADPDGYTQGRAAGHNVALQEPRARLPSHA